MIAISIHNDGPGAQYMASHYPTRSIRAILLTFPTVELISKTVGKCEHSKLLRIDTVLEIPNYLLGKRGRTGRYFANSDHIHLM